MKGRSKMASRLHRTLALVLSCNIAMTAFTASAFAADDTETASEGASVVHEHNKVNCPTCGGSHKVKVEETCPTCEGVVPEVPMVTCPDCDGEGEYQTWDFDHPCPICHETGCKDNPNCIMGYELYTVTCKTCGGAGEIPDPNAEKCETCGGKGTISVDADCPDCEDGTVDCPKTDEGFGEGTLTAVADDGEGTLHFVCSDCNAEYDEPLGVEETTAIVAKNLSVSFAADKTAIDAKKADPNDPEANRAAGLPVGYTLTVTNSNQVAAKNITVTVQLTGAVSGIAAEGAAVDEDAKTVTLTLDTLEAGASRTLAISAQTADDAQLGGNIQAQLTASMNDTVLTESEATVHINKYKSTKKIVLAGANQGYHHGSTASRYMETATVNKKGETLDTLENAALSFDGAFGGYQIDAHADGNGVVTNGYSGRRWQCIGFVPYKGYGYSDNDIQNGYIFVEKNADVEGDAYYQTFNQCDGDAAEAARAFIAEKGGVLYGAAADENVLHSWESQLTDGSLTIMAVWALAKQNAFEIRDYTDENLAIPSVPAVEYKDTDNGVTVEAGQMTESSDGHHYFDCDLTVTISPDAPNPVHINLNKALENISEQIKATANAVQPGDTIRYRLKIVNNSGRDYTYTSGSAVLGTLPTTGDAADGDTVTGFDGYPLVDDNQHAVIPRRICNRMLKNLGAAPYALDDASIGALLRAKGYGSDEMSDEDITKTCLGRYYLDCMNQNRVNDDPISGFMDLTPAEFAQMTDADNGQAVFETSPDVMRAFYYFYYGVNYTLNGQSIYDCMSSNGSGNAAAEAVIAAALSGEDAQLVTKIEGETANNAFQNTRFGFGMQFDLGYTTGGGGGGHHHRPDPKPDPKPDDPATPPVDIPDEPTPTSQIPPVTPEEIIDEEVPTGIDQSQPEETETPETKTPETVTIKDEVPTSSVPKTGDIGGLWAALCALSSCGLFALNRKRRDNK